MVTGQGVFISPQEYNRRASRLEEALRDQAPLIEWRVERELLEEDTGTAYASYNVIATTTIRGQRLSRLLSLHWYELDEWREEAPKRIAQQTAKLFAQAMLQWRPKPEGGNA